MLSTPIRVLTVLALVCASSLCWADTEQPKSDQVQAVVKSVRDYCPEFSGENPPCTCTLTTEPVYHELSCVNHAGEGPVNLRPIFQQIENSGHSNEYESLVLVNNRLTSVNESLFGGLQFHSIALYDTNFTSLGSATFSNMASTLNYLFIKGNLLTASVYTAARPLKALDTLILHLGLRSHKTIPTNALASLPLLRQVTLNGVAQTISTNAFVELPLLQSLKINNQVDTIEAGAFQLGNISTPVTIDLSENRLTENSFGVGFVQSSADSRITINLSDNWITYLPESVFRPFLEASKGNRIVITGSKLVCGQCESYWLISHSSVDKSQAEIHCHIDPHYSIWDYDWSRCPKSGVSAISGGLTSALLALFATQMWRLVFAQ